MAFWRKQWLCIFELAWLDSGLPFKAGWLIRASGSGDWWILHWASCVQNRRAIGKHCRYLSEPSCSVGKQPGLCLPHVAGTISHWGLEKWDQCYLLDYFISSVQLLIFVSSLQLGKVCPWRRYKSTSQMSCQCRGRGTTKKPDCKHVPIWTGHSEVPLYFLIGIAHLGNDCEVQLSSAPTHLSGSVICWDLSWDLAMRRDANNDQYLLCTFSLLNKANNIKSAISLNTLQQPWRYSLLILITKEAK